MCGEKFANMLNSAALQLLPGATHSMDKGATQAAALGAGAAVSAAVNSPNPWGKLGGPAHRAVVKQVTDYYRSRGYTVENEVRFDTSDASAGAFKSSRFADVAVYDEDGKLVSITQVGRQTKLGIPVMRETRAMSDIWSVVDEDVNIEFVPYNRSGGSKP